MNILLILTAIIVIIIVVFLIFLKWSHQYWKKRNLPYLPPQLPFGNFNEIKNRNKSIGNIMKDIYMQIKLMNLPHCGIYFIARPLYVVRNLDYLKLILTKDFQHFVDRGMYYNEKFDPISAHLFAVGGQKWRQLRTKLTPTFTANKIKIMHPIMEQCINLTLKTIDNSDNRTLDIKEVLCRYTTDIIGSCAFGLDCETIENDDSPFRLYGRKVFTTNRLRMIQMIIATNFPKLAHLLHVRQIPKDISEFFSNIVKDTINYRQIHQIQRPDFLQLLLQLYQNDNIDEHLTINEVIAQSFVFFLAGFETSSTTISFTLYELAKNRHIQDRMRNEIHRIDDDFDGKITYEAIQELKYMNQVIEETLRKYPPLPYVSRICVKDYQLPDSDMIIEKGTRVIIPILGIHHDDDYYPVPQRFDPERFNDVNRRQRHQYSYIPFGEGPRFCIGMRFALLQIKVALFKLLKNYQFTVNSKTKEPLEMAKNSFVLSAEGGIWLDIEKI